VCRYDFKGIIDYIFHTQGRLQVLGQLGPYDQEWFRENKVIGCPHPHVPSDHFSLMVEFEMLIQPPVVGQRNPSHISHNKR
jgi:CCR4-NOT transcription complex subunit 6